VVAGNETFVAPTATLQYSQGAKERGPVTKETQMELRAFPRIPVDLPVFFATPESEGIGVKKGSMFNLSAGGCAVTSVTTVEVGTDIALFIQVPHEDTTIKVDQAAVRWSLFGEFGLEFLRLRPEEQERLHLLLTTVQ
jgi:PilZ domain